MISDFLLPLSIKFAMSDTHTRQVEAGVSMTMLVARRVKHQLEGEEMEQAAGKLKKAMEGYIREEETFRGGKGVD